MILGIVVAEDWKDGHVAKVSVEKVNDRFLHCQGSFVPCLGLGLVQSAVGPDVDVDSVADHVTRNQHELNVRVVRLHLCHGGIDHGLRDITLPSSKVSLVWHSDVLCWVR